MSDEQIIQETTDVLLSAVDSILDTAGVGPRFVQHALIIYEVLDEDGNPKVDYVCTNTLSSTNIIGLADFAREATLAELLADS